MSTPAEAAETPAEAAETPAEAAEPPAEAAETPAEAAEPPAEAAETPAEAAEPPAEAAESSSKQTEGSETKDMPKAKTSQSLALPEDVRKQWEEARSQWKKQLSENEELKKWIGEKEFDEMLKNIEDRKDPHELERFYVGQFLDLTGYPQAEGEVDVRARFGDRIVPGTSKELEELGLFMFELCQLKQYPQGSCHES